jgi:hypothetical protein
LFKFIIQKAVSTDKRIAGPGYWAGGIIFNSAGFLCWAAIITVWNRQFFVAGELLHIIGFAALVCGVFRFTNKLFERWHLLIGGLLAVLWISAMLLMPHNRLWGLFLLMFCRSILFVGAGIMILKHVSTRSVVGRFLAGYGLVAWGIFILLVPLIWDSELLRPVSIGLPAGLHIMVVMGMILLIVEQMQARVEASEKHVQHLEGLLPICAACKKFGMNRIIGMPLKDTFRITPTLSSVTAFAPIVPKNSIRNSI